MKTWLLNPSYGAFFFGDESEMKTFWPIRNSWGPIRLATLFCVLIGWLPTMAEAASFRCDGELSAVEKTICVDPELSALDTRLAGMYWLELAMTSSKNELRSRQVAWLKEKRSKCSDESCLAIAYRKRISELDELIQQTASSPPALILAEKQFVKGCPTDRSDIFMLKLQSHGKSVTGYIDGSRYCTDKLLGSVQLTGRWVGKAAVVQVDPRWYETDAAFPAEAMIVVAGRRVFWVILTEIKVQSLIPSEVDMTRVRHFLSDDKNRKQ